MTPSIEEALRSGAADHERIWLEPPPGGSEGRLWCQDKVWPENEGDPEPIEYVRADIHQSEVVGLMKTMAAYSERALAAEAERDALREALAVEREACALMVEGATTAVNSKHCVGWGDHAAAIASMLAKRDFEIAAAIRARALTQEQLNGE